MAQAHMALVITLFWVELCVAGRGLEYAGS